MPLGDPTREKLVTRGLWLYSYDQIYPRLPKQNIDPGGGFCRCLPTNTTRLAAAPLDTSTSVLAGCPADPPSLLPNNTAECPETSGRLGLEKH